MALLHGMSGGSGLERKGGIDKSSATCLTVQYLTEEVGKVW